MYITTTLNDKIIKPVTKRIAISEAIRTGAITIQDIKSLSDALDDKKLALVFEAMESVTAKNSELADLEWLLFVQEFITSESNSLKREASRIVGNIVFFFQITWRLLYGSCWKTPVMTVLLSGGAVYTRSEGSLLFPNMPAAS